MAWVTLVETAGLVFPLVGSMRVEGAAQGFVLPQQHTRVLEQVAREDSIALRSEKQWLNAREWRRKSKKKWGLARAESNARWRSFLEDVSIPKGLDQEGWVTMPALTLLTTLGQQIC